MAEVWDISEVNKIEAEFLAMKPWCITAGKGKEMWISKRHAY